MNTNKQEVIEQYNKTFNIPIRRRIGETVCIARQIKRKPGEKKKRCERNKKHKKTASYQLINGMIVCQTCYHSLKRQWYRDNYVPPKTYGQPKKKNKLKFKKTKKKDKKTFTGWKKRVFASWKDTPEQAAIRKSPEYQKWRITVLERDKYTCQHCEKTGSRLVVHHIKTFKMHPELRLDPDNGIVLCNDCHEKLHLNRMQKPKILRMSG